MMASNSRSAEHENSIPPTLRRLKGFLALLPETGTWYPYNQNANHCDPLSPPRELNTLSTSNLCAKKITSRNQQRRFLKRCQLDAATNCTDMEQGCGSLLSNFFGKETISLANHLHDVDVAVLFLFDPYQPYSIHLLQKLISICRLEYSATTDASVWSLCDKNINLENGSPQGTFGTDVAVSASSTPQDFVCIGQEEVSNGIEQQSRKTQYPPRLHCFVVTPCKDMAIVDRLLDNSGTILVPWTQDHAAWRMATGSHVCPSIVGVYECRHGQNLFSANQEELALDWNTSIQVRNAWFHDRMSALTLLQRIQGYALYPTASICIVQ
jgi:hypothetical protein